MSRDDAPRTGEPRSGAEWFVALDTRAVGAEADGALGAWLDGTAEREAELERCTAAVEIARRLADDPDLRWAYAEAGALAKHSAADRSRRASRVARGVLGGSIAAALVLLAAVTAWWPRDPAAPAQPGAVMRRAAAIVAAAPVTSPVVLLPGSVAVDANSIAVLPFDALPAAETDPDPADPRFAADLQRGVVADLASVPGLYVVGGSSVLPYASGDFSASELGVLLGARGILRGGVRLADGRILLRAQLADAATGAVIWRAEYEHGVDDLRVLQTELVDGVTAALVDPALRTPAPSWTPPVLSARADSAVSAVADPSSVE